MKEIDFALHLVLPFRLDRTVWTLRRRPPWIAGWWGLAANQLRWPLNGKALCASDNSPNDAVREMLAQVATVRRVNLCSSVARQTLPEGMGDITLRRAPQRAAVLIIGQN